MPRGDAWGTHWGHSQAGIPDGTWLETWTYGLDQPPTSAGAGGHTRHGLNRRRWFNYPNAIDDGWELLNLAQRRRPPPSRPLRTKPAIDRFPDLAERLLAFRLGEPMPQPAAQDDDQEDTESAQLRRDIFRALALT